MVFSMSAIAERLRMELNTLDEAERAELARFLLQSLDHGSNEDEDADFAWNTELERRAEQIRSGNAIGEPAEKVFSELREKYS